MALPAGDAKRSGLSSSASLKWGQSRASRPADGCDRPVDRSSLELVSREIWKLIRNLRVLAELVIKFHISRTGPPGQTRTTSPNPASASETSRLTLSEASLSHQVPAWPSGHPPPAPIDADCRVSVTKYGVSRQHSGNNPTVNEQRRSGQPTNHPHILPKPRNCACRS